MKDKYKQMTEQASLEPELRQRGQQDFKYFTTPDSYGLVCHKTKMNE